MYYTTSDWCNTEWSDYMKPSSHLTDGKSDDNTETNLMSDDQFKQEYLRRLKAAGYKYIAKDRCGEVYAYEKSPFKKDNYWDSHWKTTYITKEVINLPEIQWYDEEPTSIEDLLELYK